MGGHFMSISPVDMQVMITKTTEVAGKHSAELHKAVADQQKVVQHENQKQDESTKKVHDRNTAERIYVDEEDKEKNKKDNEKKKSNTDDENDEEINEKKTPQEELIGKHFDASI